MVEMVNKHIRLPVYMAEKLEEVAKELNVPEAEVVRVALDRYFRELEERKKQKMLKELEERERFVFDLSEQLNRFKVLSLLGFEGINIEEYKGD